MIRRISFFIMIISLFCAPALAKSPTEVCGFVLGENIADFQDKVLTETAIPLRYQEYLKEVETVETPGFKAGLIMYSACLEPGRILRIKLKYADSSTKFYETLLKKFTDRFGKPDEWKGDSFGMLLAWKWYFTDETGKRIALVLQHNIKDPDEKLGNSVKLYYRDFQEKERICYEQKHPELKRDNKNGMAEKPDWNMLIPK